MGVGGWGRGRREPQDAPWAKWRCEGQCEVRGSKLVKNSSVRSVWTRGLRADARGGTQVSDFPVSLGIAGSPLKTPVKCGKGHPRIQFVSQSLELSLELGMN